MCVAGPGIEIEALSILKLTASLVAPSRAILRASCVLVHVRVGQACLQQATVTLCNQLHSMGLNPFTQLHDTFHFSYSYSRVRRAHTETNELCIITRAPCLLARRAIVNLRDWRPDTRLAGLRRDVRQSPATGSVCNQVYPIVRNFSSINHINMANRSCPTVRGERATTNRSCSHPGAVQKWSSQPFVTATTSIARRDEVQNVTPTDPHLGQTQIQPNPPLGDSIL